MSITNGNQLQEWLTSHAAANPDKIFIHSIDQKNSVTYREAFEFSKRIGHFLNSEGFQANDRLALMSNNSIEHLLIYLGVMAYGATACTIHVEMNALYIDEIIATIRPKIILFEEASELDLTSIENAHKMPIGTIADCTGKSFFGLINEYSNPPVNPPVNSPEDISSIFYTSGTSSKPKGVMCTFADLCENTEAVAAGFAMTAEDRVLEFRSFNWMSAQVLSVLAPLYCGATLLLARKFSSSNYFSWIKDYKATMTSGNPTTINMLINRPTEITASDIPHLRFILSSSAPLLVQDWQKFESMYEVNVIQCYGASEVGWIAAGNESVQKRGSVGKPLAYQKVTIVDADGKKLPVTDIGFIELGPHPDTEFKYLDLSGNKQITATGRVLTGDLGYLDEAGFLFVSGRQKDLIIRGGINISPLEIENTILKMPGIAEVVALGRKDKIYGEIVGALVVLQHQKAILPDDIITFCQQNLSELKVPASVKIVDHLPKTDRGKISRNGLQELWSKSNA